MNYSHFHLPKLWTSVISNMVITIEEALTNEGITKLKEGGACDNIYVINFCANRPRNTSIFQKHSEFKLSNDII
jgi:hypothetical protein